MTSHKSYVPGPHEQEFWYNLKTGQIEEGQQSRITNLWGPFATREEAEHAMEKAAHRNQEWDDYKGFWDNSEDSNPV